MPRELVHCEGCGHDNRAAARFCGRCGAPLREAAPLIGGRYRPEKQLGAGTFGRALLSTDTVLRRRCVVKQLRLDTTPPELHEQVISAFEREARLLVRLNTPGHPNIPEIYEYLPAQRSLVMKYITGRSLQQVLKSRLTPLPEETALRYARDVCSALAYMHGRTPAPVIHGDLKPANILLDTEGRIWLVDFGLARPHLRTGAGGAGHAGERPSGTPGYTPAEQWHGRVEPRSDVYALGATLFEMLTRRRPSLDPSELVLALRRATPPVSAETERLLQRALAFDAARRPEAGEMLALLERSLVRIALPPAPPPEQPPSGERFLGRDAELRAIDERLSAGRSLLLVGMPGIGKTALLGALCGPRAESDTLFYHTCLADSGLDELTYQLCAHLARQGDTAPWEYLQRARLRDDQSNLARILVDQILAALPRYAAGPALLICLDDAHLLADDPAAAALLAGLRRLARDGALRLVVASRVALAPFTEVELFRLEGLGPEAAAALLGSRRVDLDPTVLGELHRLTGGNAQFLILASDLLARGQDGPALVAGLASAPDVERYLIAEVDEGLSREERQVMQAVAALEEAGGTRDLIEHVVGRGAKRVLRALADRQLLLRRSAEDELFFQHALVRAFYADLPSRGERIRLHRGAASYFQEISPDNLQAAYHLLRAGELPQAAGLAVASSADAMNRGRLNRLRGLLEQIPVDGLAPELSTAVLLARGDAEAFAGAASAARESFTAALGRLEGAGDETSRRALTARACRSLAGALEHESPVEALGWIQRGLEALRNEDPVEAALLLHRQGSLHMALGAYETAEGVLERALTGLPEAMIDRRADTLINLGISACARGLREVGVARLRAALDLYRRTGNRWGEGTAYQNLGIDSDYAGDWQEAAAYYGQALACAELTGSVERQAHLALLLGTLATQRGDDVGAEAHLGRCVALSAEHQLLEYRAMALSSLAELHIARGSYAAAAPALEQAEQLAGQLGESFHQLPEIYRGWALVLAESDGGRAEARARQALALAQGQDEPREVGKSRRVLGQVLAGLGRIVEAEALFGEAVAALDEHDPYEAARTRVAWGQAIARLEPGRAAAMRDEARATFERLGAGRDLAALDAVAPSAPAERHDAPWKT